MTHHATNAAERPNTKPCTCTGFCRGKEGLGELWHCVLEEQLADYCDGVRKHQSEQKAKEQAELQTAIDAATAELRAENEQLKEQVEQWKNSCRELMRQREH